MLSADYGYFSDPGGPSITFLVVHVKPYGAVFACIVDSKGPTPKMVRMVSECIKLCGRVNATYRSDKERSLVRLLGDAIRQSGRTGTPLIPEELEHDRGEGALLEPLDLPEPKPTVTAVPDPRPNHDAQAGN